LQDALKQSGANRPELEHVLDYYQDQGDEERLSAARYLIRNMPYHKSYYGDMDIYRSCLDSLLPEMKSAAKYNELMFGLARFFNKKQNVVNL